MRGSTESSFRTMYSVGPRFDQLEPTLPTLNLTAGYDADPRPTLVVSIATGLQAQNLVINYQNPALKARKDLVSCIDDALHVSTDFHTWVVSAEHKENYCRYGGALWFGFVVQEQWKVISTASSFWTASPEIQAPSTPISLQSVSLSGDEQASYEATIGRLKEEIRIHERGRKQAAQEKQSCFQAVQRLKEELRSLESTTPTIDTFRSTSDDSLPFFTKRLPKTARTSSTSKQSTAKIILPVMSSEDSEATLALEKFQRLAEAVDVGFFDYDASGRLLNANESWYALSGHPKDPAKHTTLSFQQCVYPDDAELVMDQWTKLIEGHAVTFEMRWRRAPPPSAGPDAPMDAQWVLAACVPVIGQDGEVKSISGCTTDINAQKKSVEVALQRAEALERARASEERFSRFAEVAPIAIFRFDKHKNIEYCNDRWFDMTGTPRSRFEDIAWPFGVYEDDIERCSQAWEKAITDRSIGQIEFRLRKDWHDAHGRRGQAWVYCTFFAEFFEDGTFNGLMGSLLDISHLKWAENMQKLRAEEALEAKRQQENFIDITSHEMRNPLSAMVQCADSIITSLNDISSIMDHVMPSPSATESIALKEHIEAGLDSVQTILSCAAHQRRIVDDILTLSKLDSNLLLITPVKTNPIELVQGIIKMFEMDSMKADVELVRELNPSFQELDVNWLMLDPSRVSQILINLLGNAIKFTRSENTRRVTVRMSAALEPPSKHDKYIGYVPAESAMEDLGDDHEGGADDIVYLKLEVQDTGRGLTLEEKEKLFIRFSQASPKTHVQYGGSGLGLFISRKLTEMQGGEIGFASEADVGSTFAFYVRTRRTSPPIEVSKPYMSAQSKEHESATPRYQTQRKLNILLVEDNLVNQKVLSKQLERHGCTVYVAGHGVEALDFIKSTALWTKTSTDEQSSERSNPVPIDAVLMDIEMPVMGGLECTRRIRALEKDNYIVKHLPIMSISANARQEQVDEARVAGVDDTITKPFRLKELMPKLHRLASSVA